MLVTIITPVYNSEKFLEKSKSCVLNQTYKDIEWILVNDGSLDNSLEICKSFSKKDKRIKIISQKNSGPASARNNGIKHAKGEFIFFLDADDLIELKTIEILIETFKKFSPDLVISNFKKFETNGKIINQEVTFSPNGEPFTGNIKELSRNEILNFIRHFYKYPSNHLMSYCWARLYKTSIIKKMNIFVNKNMRLFEDYVFNLEYLKHTEKLIFVNKPLYTYVMQNASLSMSILNGDSLLHDMNMFRSRTNEYLNETNVDLNLVSKIKREIGHTLIHYTIIFLVRSCRQISKDNKKKIYMEIRKLINSSIIQESLKYYTPSKGNSRIIPLLIKFKLINLIMFVCNKKAKKRYGEIKNI